jgi:hypothetical protein
MHPKEYDSLVYLISKNWFSGSTIIKSQRKRQQALAC